MSESMIADSLVLAFTSGVSLRGWEQSGMVEREWALYRELVPHYRRIVLVTYGDAADREVLERLLKTDAERAVVRLICNHDGADLRTFARTAPARVVEMLRDASSVVVKTNQMMGGEVAVEITEALRAAGKSVGLVARGGYLWSRFVTYEHGPHSEAAQDASARERHLCTAADMVVGTTDDMVDDLAWRYALNPGQTRVIPNYVLADGMVVDHEGRDPATVLYAGQLVARKRADVLIEAVAADDVRERVKLKIVGEGREQQRLRDLATKLNAPVEFSARVPHRELMTLMESCTIYAQASELEGHPKTVLEAMAAGAPVLVAASPGLAEVIDHGSSGLRVQPTPDAFALAINDLLQDPEWRDLLGSTAARLVRSKFGLPTVIREEIEVHRVALSRGSSRHAQALPLRKSA